jgi:ParB/RepB/Spo0J family partition protein
MATNMTDFRSIPIAALTFSTTPAQIERRAHLDKAKLAELAQSIKSHGVVQPILVRPNAVIDVIQTDTTRRWYAAYKRTESDGHNVTGTGHDTREDAEAEAEGLRAKTGFEVVAGERRALAAKQAGLEEIQATVRDLTDEQVLELQLIENLQRQDLHELAEAEGYEALGKLGHSIDDMAAKVGKSRGTLYARMKLLALCPEARKKFYAGELTASVALLLARIPGPELQKQALKEVLEEGDTWGEDRRMSYREACEHVQSNYMLRLKEAPFPVGDEKLVPAAGSCYRCPKNTAQQRELFNDVDKASAGVCTDPVCFAAKRAAWGKQSIERAQSTGQKVIDGDEAKKATKHGTHSLTGGLVKLDEHCLSDSKQRTYREILGKKVQPALLRIPDSGDVIEVVREKDVEEHLPKSRRDSSNNRQQEQLRIEEKKRKRETAFRFELFTQVRAMAPEKLVRENLEAIAEVCFMGIGFEAQKQLLKAWGWTDKNDKPMDPYAVRGERLQSEIGAHSDSDLIVFLLDCVYAEELSVNSYGTTEKPERLLAAAKRLKIDPEKIRKELLKDERAGIVKVHPAKPAPAKPAKKK